MKRSELVGECSSSCTWILTLPPEQVCATQGAKLGFHAMMYAAQRGSDKPKDGRWQTRYRATCDAGICTHGGLPEDVKTWLRESGALKSTKMTYVLATKSISPVIRLTRPNWQPS